MANAQKNSPNKEDSFEKKYKLQAWRRYLWLLWLLIIVPIIYFAVQVFIIVVPRFEFERALLETMTESVIAQGIVSLDSFPVRINSPDGTLYYTVPIGERVSAETPVAEVYSSGTAADARVALEQVNSELASLQAAQKTLVDSGDVDIYRKQLQSGIYDLLNSISSHDYSQIKTPKANVTLAFNKLQIATGEVVGFDGRIAFLTSQQENFMQTAVATNIITSPETGYFVPATKYDTTMPNYDTLFEYSAPALMNAINGTQNYYSSDIIGHIITDYKWHYFAIVSEKEAVKFIPGDKSLEIRFPDISEKTYPVRVENVSVDETSTTAKVEFFSEYISPAIMQMRVEKAQIIFRTEKGIRIPNEAMRIIDGEKGVYIRFGNIASFRKVDIILENEDYFLIKDKYLKGENEVRLYDEIIVDSGGTELYDGKYL